MIPEQLKPNIDASYESYITELAFQSVIKSLMQQDPHQIELIR